MKTKAIGRQDYIPDICNMKIAVVAATSFEWMPIQKQITNLLDLPAEVQVTFHTTGIGLLASTYHLTTLSKNLQPDIIIQAGIAGSFDKNLHIGEVIVVKQEYSGDLGVIENAAFIDVFDMRLVQENEFPFNDKALQNPWLNQLNLPHLKGVTGITVNEISTSSERISVLQQKYNCSTESMEGAALHYVGLQTKTPFIQIRAISNYVGERDKSKWNIKLAIDELAHSTTKLIHLLADARHTLLTHKKPF